MHILKQFEEISNGKTNYSLPCIYKITNTTNGKFYIGQSSCFYNRMKDHIMEINRQQAIKLQLNMNKYCTNGFSSLRRYAVYHNIKSNTANKLNMEYREFDHTNFTMEIIEIVSDISKLDIKERYYISTLNAEASLNGNGGNI